MPPIMKAVPRRLLAAGLLVLATGWSAQAVEIERVRGPETGVEGLLVEDRTNPIVTVRIAFEGGALAERDGEEGLANLLSTMLNEGAGNLDAEAFQDRLDALGARFFASSSRESFRVGVSALSDRLPQAVELLALALNEPRFDDDPLARMKRQVATSLEASRDTPRARARRQVAGFVWGDHPYARDDDGDPAIVRAADADDLRAVHGRLIGRDNAVVGAVGAIDAAELEGIIDRLFAELPAERQVADIPDAAPRTGLEETIRMPGSQASIRAVLPAPRREDDDFFAAYLVNHILGGGSFTSRLFKELREDRGLTYGAGSGIATYDRGALWSASVSTRPENVDEARDVLLGEIERMAREGPTEAELAAAKAYVKGAYAINNLASSRSIAGVLLGLQENGLGDDYLERREALIDAVTIEDARAAAARYLSVQPTVITVLPEAAG